MSQVPAGWFNDPYGRFQQRYWDGARWTEHVATEGRAMVDPMGASPVVPFATPASALDGDAAAAVAGAADAGSVEADATPRPGSIALLERMGAPARERTRPSLRAAVAGLGGAVFAVGVIALVAGESAGRGRIIAGSLVVLVAAVAARWFAHWVEVQAASIGMLVVGLGFFGVAATESDGRGTFLTGLVLAVLFIAAWASPGFRGVNMLLAIGLLALLAGFGSLSSTDTDQIDRCNEFLDAGDFDSFDAECQDVITDNSGLLPNSITDTLGDQGAIYLFGAALFLAGTWVLDRRDYRGTATAFTAAGLLAALAGTALLVSTFGGAGGPLFVAIVGALVCLVGSHGARRATTWWGAALVAGGMVAFIGVMAEPSSNTAVAATAIVSGLLLVAVPWAASRLSGGSAARR